MQNISPTGPTGSSILKVIFTLALFIISITGSPRGFPKTDPDLSFCHPPLPPAREPQPAEILTEHGKIFALGTRIPSYSSRRVALG